VEHRVALDVFEHNGCKVGVHRQAFLQTEVDWRHAIFVLKNRQCEFLEVELGQALGAQVEKTLQDLDVADV